MSYSTLLADPPWFYDKQVGKAAGQYPRLRDDEVLALPVASLASPSAHLYLWAVDVKLELALACVRRWGFRMVATIPWIKMGRSRAIQIGPGNYVRKEHELCLFSSRGKAYCVRPGLRPGSVLFFDPRGTHSEKPPTLHRIAETLSPGPRIELFARRARRGWTAWPPPGRDAREFLARPVVQNLHRSEVA